jgi:hypothetical protein
VTITIIFYLYTTALFVGTALVLSAYREIKEEMERIMRTVRGQEASHDQEITLLHGGMTALNRNIIRLDDRFVGEVNAIHEHFAGVSGSASQATRQAPISSILLAKDRQRLRDLGLETPREVKNNQLRAFHQTRYKQNPGSFYYEDDKFRSEMGVPPRMPDELVKAETIVPLARADS